MNSLFTTNAGSGNSLVLHMLAIALCLVIAFKVRGQPGGLFIMVGVGLTLVRQLFSLSIPLDYTSFLADFISPRANILLSFGSLVLAFGLIGIGIMRQNQVANGAVSHVHRWMNIALFSVITIELCLIVDQLVMTPNNYISGLLYEFAHVVSLSLLALIVILRHIHQSYLKQTNELVDRQTDAMISMFTSVKHELNNDMQVVVGNAELAEIMTASGADVSKPLGNIAKAANAAVSRIEQLSVFSAVNELAKVPVDVNAMFRQCAAELNELLPDNITIRLELERIPFRVIADRYLLALTLSNLVRQSLPFMHSGGEIVFLTRDVSGNRPTAGTAAISADVSFVYSTDTASAENLEPDDKNAKRDKEQGMKVLLTTTSALVELGGGVSVNVHSSALQARIQMGFVNEAPNEPPIRAGIASARVS